jgi:UDP-galactopyranose mutase
MVPETEQRIVILGGGLAGLAAGFGLGRGEHDFTIYEAGERAGGVARSVTQDGFVFDHGPHILFPKVARAKKLIQDLLAGNLLQRSREAWIYHHTQKIFTRFPFQHHLHGLHPQVVRECLLGAVRAFIEARAQGEDVPPPVNYRQWLESSFGSGITRHLMGPYAIKLWTVDPEEMSYTWIGDRVPVPDLEQIISGALSDVEDRFGFNPEFWYPREGGIESLPRSFLPLVGRRLKTGMRAVKIDLRGRLVHFADGSSVRYRRLVYTLPLPELTTLMEEIPGDVRSAINGLKHNSILCVNLGVNRPAISDKHWIYFYEDRFPFHRISFPMNLSPATTPPGMSSISTEVAYAQWRQLDKETIVQQTVAALKAAGILLDSDTIVTERVMDIRYAYIIYDLQREAHLEVIYRFLRQHGVEPCGRFGRWEYLNMDRTIDSGLTAADLLNGEPA